MVHEVGNKGFPKTILDLFATCRVHLTSLFYKSSFCGSYLELSSNVTPIRPRSLAPVSSRPLDRCSNASSPRDIFPLCRDGTLNDSHRTFATSDSEGD